MSDVKHTPGPWKTRDGFSDDEIDVFAPNPKVKPPWQPTELAVVKVDEDEPSQGKANARLIAAAPELLEALRGILEHCNRYETPELEPAILQAQAAIAKAEGTE